MVSWLHLNSIYLDVWSKNLPTTAACKSERVDSSISPLALTLEWVEEDLGLLVYYSLLSSLKACQVFSDPPDSVRESRVRASRSRPHSVLPLAATRSHAFMPLGTSIAARPSGRQPITKTS